MSRNRQQSDTLHEIPTSDVIAHERSEDCICGPTATLTQRPGKSDLWLHVHHPLSIGDAA